MRGEEVTLSYFPLDWPHEERAARLAGEYGFVCGCARCALEAPEARPSDESMASGSVGGSAAGGGGLGSARASTGPAAAPQPPADPGYVGAFLSKFCCSRCSGTLAPAMPGGDEGDHVCNACGAVRSHADFMRSLEEDDDVEWEGENEEGEQGMEEV